MQQCASISLFLNIYLTVRWTFLGKRTTQGSNFLFLPNGVFHSGAPSGPGRAGSGSPGPDSAVAPCQRAESVTRAGLRAHGAARGRRDQSGSGEVSLPDPVARRAGGRLEAARPSRTSVRGGWGVSSAPLRTVVTEMGLLGAARGGGARSARVRRAGGGGPITCSSSARRRSSCARRPCAPWRT